MYFNLPNQLASEVASYDTTRKKLVASESNKTRKQTYPNGRPSNLIPYDIVNDETWSNIVDQINSSLAQQKVQLITRPVFGQEPKPVAIVYYFKQLWIAAWLPRRKDDGYYYGITVTYKDTAAARKQCTQKFFRKERNLSDAMFNQQGEESEMMPRIKDGRTYWYRKSLFFTQDTFEEGYTNSYWRHAEINNHTIKSYGNSWQINREMRTWEMELFKGIPMFKDCMHANPFKRLDPEQCKFETIMSNYEARPQWSGYGDEYVHDVDKIIKSISCRWDKEALQDIWTAKWFRSLVLNAMHETKRIHDQESVKMEYNLKALKPPFAILYQFVDSIVEIKRVYTTMDLNLLHSRFDWLSKTTMPGYHSNIAQQWMRDNLPVESFLNMLYQTYKKEIENSPSRRSDSATGQRHVYMHIWRDTYNMLSQLITAKRIDNLKPRRWRLNEWHDHLMAETWKLRNPNVDLQQKLFPEPIKVSSEETKFSFFQPIDTHQLASWGKAVRNCVGSTNYSDGIKKMKHLIVLCMIDNKPRYTIQLTVNNGVMNVDQIADIGNKRLDDQERAMVQETFSKALQQRENQLSQDQH